MPGVCLYFQVHQPYRIKRYTYFDIGSGETYFDEHRNRSIMERVAAECYLPANRCLLDLIQRHEGRFKVAFSISGTALEQMKLYAPKALESFRELAATGAVEFLGETYYHSLAMLYGDREYREQVRKHSQVIQSEFGKKPRVLRNTELIYSDDLGARVTDLGFDGVLAEGVDDVLGWRSPNFVYVVPGQSTRIVLKNHRLSDDIAFRFSRIISGDSVSLKASDFANSLHALTGNSSLVGLFLDYETFGEHHKRGTGIFEFLSSLPGCVLAHPEWEFLTPSESVARENPAGDLSFPRVTSWADTARDASAWCGNRMQACALERVFNWREFCGAREIYSDSMASVREVWRRLQASDHFYYMSTKGANDGEVHSYFSPFESPYEAFIAYMNVLKDFTLACENRDSPDGRRPPSSQVTR